jgi:putative nucleotidyltransferase with HDIG domain
MSQKRTVLLAGLSEEVKHGLEDLLAGCELVATSLSLETLMDLPDVEPMLVLTGDPADAKDLAEVAQALRMRFQETAIFYACGQREGYNRKLQVKNGFTDAFLLPMDLSSLRTAVEEALSGAGVGKSFRSVKLVDIQPDTVLAFDTYVHLPANNKHIRYSAAGDSLDADRLERLKAGKGCSVKVSTDQIQDFYRYTATQLRALGCSEGLGATERRERMQSAVRDLLTGIFKDNAQESGFAQGGVWVKDCQEIVKLYVADGKKDDWYNRLLTLTSEKSDGYSHSANVASFAALFSMGLGIGNPEELAMAGFLHDIGMVDVPAELQAKDEETLSEEEAKVVHKHVESGLEIIRARKLTVPEKVLKAISQHHERFCGTGYPKGLAGNRIAPEAQILALADAFDSLTSLQPGRAPLGPREAIQLLCEKASQDATKVVVDPELLKKALTLLNAA